MSATLHQNVVAIHAAHALHYLQADFDGRVVPSWETLPPLEKQRAIEDAYRLLATRGRVIGLITPSAPYGLTAQEIA